MIELEVHPGIHVREQSPASTLCTCRRCHRSFRAGSEDQHSVELCDTCFDELRHSEDAIPTVHVKVRPRRSHS